MLILTLTDSDTDADINSDWSSSTDSGSHTCIITSESLRRRPIPVAKQAIIASQINPIAANTANVNKAMNLIASKDKYEKSNESERIYCDSLEAEPE